MLLPFKDNLRKEWYLWMANGGAEKTAAGNLRRTKYSDIYNWVKCSWENISSETIINSFVNCDITELLDSDNEELEISDIDDDTNSNTDDNEKVCDDDEIHDDDKIRDNDCDIW